MTRLVFCSACKQRLEERFSLEALWRLRIGFEEEEEECLRGGGTFGLLLHELSWLADAVMFAVAAWLLCRWSERTLPPGGAATVALV